MSNGALPQELVGIPPLDVPEELILQRVQRNPESRTARVLSAALQLSIEVINPEAPEESIGPSGIVERFGNAADLQTLNEYRVILSKKEGCQVLAALGVRRLQDKPNFLNRYLGKDIYESVYGRKVSSIQGKGKNKLLFTYGEIIHFYTVYLGKFVPDPLPSFPRSLLPYADEVDSYLRAS